jgi:hypothetical protein
MSSASSARFVSFLLEPFPFEEFKPLFEKVGE